MKKNEVSYPPLIFSIFKPAGITSYDVVRHFKRNLPQGYGKIGHFGTLDPFASGLLLIGVAGAARLNDYVHEYSPKTYLAIGKLGVETETGDLTVPPSAIDESVYLKEKMAKFEAGFIQAQIREKFLGTYWQSPHKYSAAKFEGKPLHQWAREGVEIKKEQVERFVHELSVVKFQFPYLSIRATVSSGTYVRTLFSDIARYLGTYGTLVSLVRERIGPLDLKSAIYKKDWPVKESGWDYRSFGKTPEEVLPFEKRLLTEEESKRFLNGATLELGQTRAKYQWCSSPSKLLGLATLEGEQYAPIIVFSNGSSL